MLNIVIPTAGLGSRFVREGFDKPKPFIDVAGKPMIVRVLENIRCSSARVIIVARKEHLDREQELVEKIKKDFNTLFIPLKKPTEGTACTVLHARKHIDAESPLLIVNSDQIVDIKISDFVADCFERKLDGSILTFVDPYKDTKWSFVRIDKNGLVLEVKEKEAISEYGTVGIYLYSKAKYFVDAAIDMMIENDRVNNEFYTCPTYNYAILNGCRIGIYNIKLEEMHGMGTPEDLNRYLEFIK